MVIGILQPGYLPWLGFFEQLYRSDLFVIYDDVQYDKQGWRNRNRIKTVNGVQWLTVPVRHASAEHQLILEVRIDNRLNWRKKHLESIRQSYVKAPFFEKYFTIFEEAYSRDWEYLIDLDLYFIEKLAHALGILEKPLIRSSALDIKGGRIDRLIKICNYFNAATFYEGAAGSNYIDQEEFIKKGITVVFQDYVHPVYPQMHGGFIPYLSLTDLLFNCGDQSLEILLNNN